MKDKLISCSTGFPAVSTETVGELLERSGVKPTAQRLAIARVLAGACCHWSAEQVGDVVGAEVSRATVYNTLNLFREKRLIREVIVDPSKVFYDANTRPHYHLYEADSGKLSDIDAEHVQIIGMQPLPEGMVTEGIDLIVRIRRQADKSDS